MRGPIVTVALSLVVSACGQPGPAVEPPLTTSSVSETTATALPEPSSTAGASTTLREFSGTSPSPRGELDRSVLSLGLLPGHRRPGRFRLEPGPNTETLMGVEGRYWVSDDGNVYTALDVDTELIAQQMALLSAAVEATRGESVDSPYLASLRDHYRGDEFQIGLTDLIRSTALGGLPAEWAEQWGWFIQEDGNPVPAELVACREAIASLDEAARAWVDDLEIEFVDGTWVLPVAAFQQALAAEVEEASICDLFFEGTGADPEMLISLSGEPEQRRLEVLVDDNIYSDRESEQMFAIVMWPDGSVGPPPSEPDPAPLLTLRGSYLTAIGVCGELPWIYSNFAAADTYYSPDSSGYIGPVVFTSGWYCEEQVPEERRSLDG